MHTCVRLLFADLPGLPVHLDPDKGTFMGAAHANTGANKNIGMSQSSWVLTDMHFHTLAIALA